MNTYCLAWCSGTSISSEHVTLVVLFLFYVQISYVSPCVEPRLEILRVMINIML